MKKKQCFSLLHLLLIINLVFFCSVLQANQVTIQAGKWSDVRVWESGRLPTENDDVEILHDIELDKGRAKQVQIRKGTATLTGDMHLHGSLVVHSRLRGTQGGLYFHVPDDRLFTGNSKPGNHPAGPDYHFEDIGLWAMRNSSIDLSAAEVTPWLNAMPLKTKGKALKQGGLALPTITKDKATLQRAPKGWQAGDTLLLSSVRGKTALVTLTAVQGTQIQYKANNTELSPFSAATISVEGRNARPKVANLSRRLVIASADVKAADSHHRAHTIFMQKGDFNLRYVEFRNLGPRRTLGRYPIHFHLSGRGAQGSEVLGCSIWQDINEGGSRFITIHATDGVTLKDNVGFRSQGHGFYMESGPEVGNQLINNLSVDVRGPEELKSFQDQLAKGTHHYWLRAGNRVQGNVAIGGNKKQFGGATALSLKNKKTVKSHSAPIGMVLLPASKPAPKGYPPVIAGSELYNMPTYGIWSGIPKTQVIDTTVAFAGKAAWHGGTQGLKANQSTLKNFTALYNGDRSTKYGAGIYSNNESGLKVIDGLFVGKLAMHTHYNSSASFSGTTFRTNFLLEPTYFEIGVLIEDCDFKVNKLFKQFYPLRRNAPGLVRMKNCHGSLNKKNVKNFSHDFTHAQALHTKSFRGKKSSGKARVLKSTASMSGYLALPKFPRKTLMSVAVKEKPFGKAQYIRERLKNWKLHEKTAGYPDGYPPGSYKFRFKLPNGKVQTYACELLSGQVTQLTSCKQLKQKQLKA